MPTSDQRLAGAFLALTALWSLTLAAIGSHEALLFMAPALLLVLPLAFGRYLGEKRLESARARLSRSARPRLRVTQPPAPRLEDARLVLPRGGSLIATALAKRPPPLALSLT